MAGGEQFGDDRGADVSGCPGDEHAHGDLLKKMMSVTAIGSYHADVSD
jgi:hypothetical protein